jgi:hypothetical protein
MTTACDDEGPNSYDRNNSRYTRRSITRARREIAVHLKLRPSHIMMRLIASQPNGRAFSNVTLSMLFKEIYEMAGIGTGDVRSPRA